MNVARQAAKGTMFVFAGDTSSAVILSITSIIIARMLGPSEYGLYSIALAVPSLMLLFTDLGINPALIRYLVSCN
jgi:O-antigen/teichoic acid export membrane protein